MRLVSFLIEVLGEKEEKDRETIDLSDHDDGDREILIK